MKIVFRSSNVNKAYTINYQVQDVPVGSTIKNEVRNTNVLVITPRVGYVIDAKDFTHGLLPDGINNIIFNNSSKIINYSNQVHAIITLDNNFTATGNENIVFDIPISGVGKIPANEVEIIASVPENNDIIQSTVLGSQVQTSNTVMKNGIKSTTYKLTGKKGLKILLFQKVFKAFDDHYFVSPPTYKLNAQQRKRYDVRTYTEYGESKRVILRKIAVYYTFPTEDYNSKDYINFTAAISKIFARKNDANYVSSLSPTIYSVKTLGEVGPRGGIIPIEVRGTPGTPFRVSIQNTSGQIYDQEQGAFVTGGQFLTGTIPTGGNSAIGVYRTKVDMPSIYENTTNAAANNYVSDATKGNSLDVRLIKEKDTKTDILGYKDKRREFVEKGLDQSDIQQYPDVKINIFPDYVYSPNGTDGSSGVSSFAHSASYFRKQNMDTFRIIETTELTDGTSQDTATIQLFGAGRKGGEFLYNFEYTLTPSGATYGTNGYIRIIRQPKFILFDGKPNTDTAFRPWVCDASGTITCSDANTKNTSVSTGKELTIYNDFLASEGNASNVTENNYGSSYRINCNIRGIGKSVASTGDASGDSDTYKYFKRITLTGSISGITYPNRDLNIAIKLQNFLSLKNIT